MSGESGVSKSLIYRCIRLFAAIPGVGKLFLFPVRAGSRKTGAGEGTRTLDINLGKVAFYL